MRFSSLQGIVCRNGPRLSGSRGSAMAAVSGPGDAVPFRPSAGPCGSGSFPLAACPLRSVFAFLPAPPCGGRGLPWGFFPLRGVTAGVHVSRASQFPRRSVLRFSQPLDGLLRHRLRGLVSSRCHVQGFRSGVCSRPAAVPARRRFVPPCPCRSAAHRLPGCHKRASGLRGFVPRDDACVNVGGWPSSTPLPSSVSPPPGPGARTARPRHYSAAAPLVVFAAECSPRRCRKGARPAVNLQRIGDPSAGGSSPRPPACSRFLPSAGPFTREGAGPDDEALTTGNHFQIGRAHV